MTGHTLSRALLLAAALGGLVLPAAAQTRYPYSLTLYDQPDYRGGSVTFYGDNANIGSTGFANRARSAQIRGTWRLCEGGGYRNRCEVLNFNIRDLDAYGFAGRVGSAQLLGAGTSQPAPLPPAPATAARPPAYAPQPYAPAAPPAAPYRPAPYSGPPASPAPPGPYRSAPYEVPAPAPSGPTYVAPYTAGGYEPVPETQPPALDAPMAGPGRFGRAYDPPATAPLPRPYPQPDAQPAPLPAQPAPYARPPMAHPPAAQAYGYEPAQGQATVFFPMPLINGADVSASSPRAADGFCRSQGLGPAIHFDQIQRLWAVDVDGRAVGEGPVLRDVLCRR